ncbi:unnamed protein product [Ranitomeya imitator]|uniref:Uncharacterized protein n=1 Tax=Ranitomeya imitator TaxID=111125 RepID=A0ABN9MJL6_9NEOB|nr:unnamed protein product [Ranitomeya imitator]
MNGSNTMLGCSTGAITPAGINLSGMLPSGGLVPGTMPGTLPATMQSASQAGGPYGIKNSPNLRPLNLLQLPGASLIFNPMQQQQQPQLSQYSPQQTATSSPQQNDQLGLMPLGMEQGPNGQEQTLTSQQAAVINLTGVGGFMPQQTAGMYPYTPSPQCLLLTISSPHTWPPTLVMQHKWESITRNNHHLIFTVRGYQPLSVISARICCEQTRAQTAPQEYASISCLTTAKAASLATAASTHTIAILATSNAPNGYGSSTSSGTPTASFRQQIKK